MDTVLIGCFEQAEAGSRALARAADVAEAFGARLVVVSITDLSPPAVREPVPVLEPAGLLLAPTSAGPVPVARPAGDARTRGPEDLPNVTIERARSYLGQRDVDAEFVEEAGDPVERLLEAAEEHDADLIVVGSPERGFLERLLGRPVDEALTRRADRDVLLVR